MFTGSGWKKLDADNLPLIQNDTVGCVRIPVYTQNASRPDGYSLEVVGDHTGKLFAQTPSIPVASAAVVPGATDVLFGPKDGLMSGETKRSWMLSKPEQTGTYSPRLEPWKLAVYV